MATVLIVYGTTEGQTAKIAVRTNRDTLKRLPSGFFSVSLAAHGDLDEAQGYLEQFEDETGWHPAKVALFAGALLYTRYGFIKRRMMKRIARDKPGHLGVDTSRDYIYTEWVGVKRFAEKFAADLIEHKAPPAGAAPSSPIPSTGSPGLG